MRSFARTFFVIVALCLLPHPAAGQCQESPAGTFTCEAGPARMAEFEYSGLIAGDVFRLYVDNAQVGTDVPASNGTVQIEFGAGLPAGSYQVAVSAWRGTVEARTNSVTLVLTPPPPVTPSNLRIVRVILRGLDEERRVLWEHSFDLDVLAMRAGQ